MGKEGEKRKHDDANNNRSPGSDYEEEKKKRKLERKLEKLNKKLQKREAIEGEKNVSTPSSSSSSSATTTEATPTSTNSSIETLTVGDYYRKYQEFRLWLLNNKKLRIEDDLDSTEEIQHYFKKFIKKWNSGKLSSKYYSKTGVHTPRRTTMNIIKRNNRTFIGQEQKSAYCTLTNNHRNIKLNNVKFNVNNIWSDHSEQIRNYSRKVDGFLSDMHQKVFSSHIYTRKIFHVAVDGYTQKKYKEACEFFTQVIEKGAEAINISKNPPINEFTIEKQILWSLIYRGVITNSYDDLQKAKQLNPFHPEIFYRRGNLFYFDHDYINAIKDYSKAIANNPNFTECYFNRGLCHYQLRRFDRAVKDLETYLKHAPNDPNTLKILGICYYNQYTMYDSRRELIEKSVEALTNYIEHRKSHSLPIAKEDYLTRGSALRILRKIDLSQQDFQSGNKASVQSFIPPIIITPVDCFTQEGIAPVTL